MTYGALPSARHITLPSGSTVSSQRPEPVGAGEVVAWEYAPVLESGERWAARGEAAALVAKDAWSAGKFSDGETYDPVVGIDRRRVVITYGEWERV